MSPALEAMYKEFQGELSTTKRVLGRIPVEHLGWKPHPTSMPLGQLAMHIASLPGFFSSAVLSDQLDLAKTPVAPPVCPDSLGQISDALNQSVQLVEQCCSQMSPQKSIETWRITLGQTVVLSRPRIEVLRSAFLNHWYHHRGQVAVYLRMLGVPVPAIYGGSGDESPFN